MILNNTYNATYAVDSNALGSYGLWNVGERPGYEKLVQHRSKNRRLLNMKFLAVVA